MLLLIMVPPDKTPPKSDQIAVTFQDISEPYDPSSHQSSVKSETCFKKSTEIQKQLKDLPLDSICLVYFPLRDWTGSFLCISQTDDRKIAHVTCMKFAKHLS
jgi:hypothetical protein